MFHSSVFFFIQIKGARIFIEPKTWSIKRSGDNGHCCKCSRMQGSFFDSGDMILTMRLPSGRFFRLSLRLLQHSVSGEPLVSRGARGKYIDLTRWPQRISSTDHRVIHRSRTDDNITFRAKMSIYWDYCIPLVPLVAPTLFIRAHV